MLDFNVLAEQAYLNFNDRSIVLAHGHKLDEKNIPALRKAIFYFADIHMYLSVRREIITYT